jgi:hypothetical protein
LPDCCVAGLLASVSAACFEVVARWLLSTFFSDFKSFAFAGSAGTEMIFEASGD